MAIGIQCQERNMLTNEQVIAARGPQASGSHFSVLERLLPRVADYCRPLFELTRTMGHEFGDMFSSHAEKAHAQLMASLDEAMKNTPAVFEPVVKAARDAVDNKKISTDLVRDAFRESGKSDKCFASPGWNPALEPA
jgi:hypothetical protein